MTDNNNDNNDNNDSIVSECPYPPFYYKYFNNDNILIPPQSPIQSTLSLQYNGIVSSQLNGRQQYNDNKNYKNELKLLIEKLLTDSLILIETTSYNEPLRNFIENLDTTINSIYTCLNEYRQHEAREHLIDDVNIQLSNIQRIENTLKRYLSIYLSI